MPKYIVLIPCAGSGSRFKSELPKQYHKIAGKTVLDWTILAFSKVELISEIVIVANKDDRLITDYVNKYAKVKVIFEGGETRAQTVINGINYLYCDDNDWILVHDAARCCISPHDISKLISNLDTSLTGGILAKKTVDTIKFVETNHLVSRTIDRKYIFQAQTPQMFRSGILKTALSVADTANITDEASAVEMMGKQVEVVEADHFNLKITFPEDILLAETILVARENFKE